MTDEVLRDEVLRDEVLGDEVLKNKKQVFFIPEIFNTIIDCVYPTFKKFKDWPEYAKEEPSGLIKQELEKLLGAAEKILSAFEQLERKLPEYRCYGWREIETTWSSSAAKREAVDQIESYADYCRLTGRHLAKDVGLLQTNLLGTDWCEELKKWADENDYSKDVLYDYWDDKLHSYWVVEYFYYDVRCFECKRTGEIIPA